MEPELPSQKIERYEPAARFLERRRPALPARYDTVELEEVGSLLAYWRILRKRRWTILTLTFVCFTLVFIWTLKQKPVYRAQALLEIESEDPEIVSVQQLFQVQASESQSYLETQYRMLQSASLARRVIEDLNLLYHPEFNPGVARPAARGALLGAEGSRNLPANPEEVAQLYQQAVRSLLGRLKVRPVRGSRLAVMSFEAEEPEFAARVVNALASKYIELSLERRWAATQKATEWLSQQLTGMKARLEKSEDELQQYARENGLLFLESESGNPENIVSQQLRQLQEELSRAQAERIEKESYFRLIRSGDAATLGALADSEVVKDLRRRLSEARQLEAQLAATFAPDYPKVKEVRQQVTELEAHLAREQERAAERIANEYQASLRREELLHRTFEEQQGQANRIAERSVHYNILKREVDTNKQLYNGLLQRLKEAGVSAGLKASNIRIVDAAEPPETPARPHKRLNFALGLLVGLSLGTGAAFLQEHLDNTLKTAEDVERYLRVPALALIPSVESLDGRRGRVYGLVERGKLLTGRTEAKGQPPAGAPESGAPRWYRIDTEGQQHSALGEAFRSLRTSVLLSTAERPPRSLLVSSSQPGEGKTTISTNLAISLAQLGQRVLIIDGDMRRPCIHKIFGITDSPGLVSYLTGQQDWTACVRPTGIGGLEVLVCGPVPPNPAELLSAERMRALVREAMADYSFVLVDSPPLLNVADARILATLVEGLVMVVKGGATPRELVQRAQVSLRDVGAHLIGVVLNNLDVQADDYYYYRYYRYDYYGSRDDAPQGS